MPALLDFGSLAIWATKLVHEPWDDTVKVDAIVKASLRQTATVTGRHRQCVAIAFGNADPSSYSSTMIAPKGSQKLRECHSAPAPGHTDGHALGKS